MQERTSARGSRKQERKRRREKIFGALGGKRRKDCFDVGEDIWPVKKQNNCRKINHFSEMRKKGWEIKGGRRILVILQTQFHALI